MKYAAKLKLPPVSIMSQHVLYSSRDVGVSADRPTGLVVLELLGAQKVHVRDVLPAELRPHLLNVTIIRVRKTFPHAHVGTGKCAINWYLEVNGETTSFYEGEAPDVSDSMFVESNKAYTLPDPNQLRVVESFVAQENEAWLLDVLQPHSVSSNPAEPDLTKRYMPTEGHFRLAMHATFDLPFAVVRGHLQPYME